MQRAGFLILGLLVAFLFLLKGLDFLLGKIWINPYQFGNTVSAEVPLYPANLIVKVQVPSIFESKNQDKTVWVRTNAFRSLDSPNPTDYSAIAIGSMTTSNELVEENQRWPALLPEKAVNFGYRGTGYALAKNTLKFVLEKTPIRPKTIYLLSALTDVRCFLENNCLLQPEDSFLKRIQSNGENYLFGEAIEKSTLYSFLSFQWNNFWGYPLDESRILSIPENETDVPQDLFEVLNQQITTQLMPKRKQWLRELIHQKPADIQLILLTQPNAYRTPLRPEKKDLRNRPILRMADKKYVFTIRQTGQWIEKINAQTKQLAALFHQDHVDWLDTDTCVMQKLSEGAVYWKGQFSPEGNLAMAECITSEAQKSRQPPKKH